MGAEPGRLLGYACGAPGSRELALQISALREAGVAEGDLYVDADGAAGAGRPGFGRLAEAARAGDVVVVKGVGQLGRSCGEVLEGWRSIAGAAGADVVVLDAPLLDTRAANRPAGVSGVVEELLDGVARAEREGARRQQAAGIADAQARGVRFGRPRKMRPACYRAVRESYLSGGVTRKEAARRLKVCPSTFDRWMREDAEPAGKAG